MCCAVAGGDYYRLLHDGGYDVTVSAEGYYPATKCVTVQNAMYLGSNVAREAQEVDFTLAATSGDKPEDAEADAKCNTLGQAVQTEESNEEEEQEVMEVGAGFCIQWREALSALEAHKTACAG